MELTMGKMSDKERAIQSLDRIPAYEMESVIAFLQGIIAEEEADDAFCKSLIAEYEADDEKGDLITIDEMAEICGISLQEGNVD